MTILNQTNDGLYNVLIILVRVAIRFIPRTEEQLLAACGSEVHSVDTTQLQNTLRRWTTLGLFEVGRDTIAIGEPYGSILTKNPDTAETQLPKVVRSIALHPDNNARFWDADGARSADFSKGAAWMLAQDIYSLPSSTSGWAALLAEQLVSQDTTIVQNDTRWRGLRAWMPYLGFARDAGTWDVDPTPALRDALPDIFGTAKTLLAGDFLERAAAALPVLDGGQYRRDVEAVLDETCWPKPVVGSLSTSLSRALQRLDREGSIRLDQRSDTGEGAVLTGRGRKRWRDFSHISIVSKKAR